MTDVRLPASGNMKVRWHAVNAFANPAKPTPAELNGGLDITDDISWNDFDFGLQASNTVNDPSLKAKSNTSDRGAMQYGGSLSLYLPRVLNDASNSHAVAHQALKTPRTIGWVSIQLDGEMSETNTPTYTGGITQTAASGDFVDLFKVQTGGYAHQIVGEDAFRETITLLQQGDAYVNAVVATTLTVDVTPATATVAVNAHAALAATVNGRDYTHGVRWSTSDASKVRVSQNGVVTRIASGSATITATYAGASDTAVIS